MINYDENWALNIAVEASIKSPCQSKRGVVMWSRKLGIISTGFNAPPKISDCDGSDLCKSRCSKTAIHAEQMAILNVGSSFVDTDDIEMLHVKTVNGKPVFSDRPSCYECSKLILGCKFIKYMWLYRKDGFTKYTAEDFHEQTLTNCGLK